MNARVTLTRRGRGLYEVRRGTQQWTPPVLVRFDYLGWDITHAGIGVGSLPTRRAARDWLDGPDGQKWLDRQDGAAP